nr:zinc finger protein BALDIBIS-like isoform X1 [Ipomoea batatas]
MRKPSRVNNIFDEGNGELDVLEYLNFFFFPFLETEAEATALLVVVEPNAEKWRYHEEQRSSHSLQFSTTKRRLLQMAAPPANMLGLSSQNHWFHGSGSVSSSWLLLVMKEEDDRKISSMFYEAAAARTVITEETVQNTHTQGLSIRSKEENQVACQKEYLKSKMQFNSPLEVMGTSN